MNRSGVQLRKATFGTPQLRPLVLALLWLFSAMPALGQSCDDDLLARARGPHGYQLRGERCEGIYARPVGGSVLYLISLTGSFEDYDPLSGQPLRLTWSAPGDNEVQLRAEGIERQLYYRMDARRPPGAGAFEWPTGILAAQRITKDSLGIRGWTTVNVGGVDRDVYLPLSISQADEPVRCGSYQLVLWPGVRMREVYVSLAPVGTSGETDAFIKEDEPLRYGYYPAEFPIVIELPKLVNPGLYYLKIGADPRQGPPRTLEYWFYHSLRSDC